MSQKKLSFAIFGNIYQAKKSVSIQKLLACLESHGADIYIEEKFYDFLTKGQSLSVKATGVFCGSDYKADFIISLGGDGTLLRSASFVAERQTPILGINMGRMGFLADVVPSEIEQAIASLYEGRYSVEEHTAIVVEAEGSEFSGPVCALNDIAVLKRDNAAMISIRASIDGEYLMTYQADGLIVSTPTGSTAYSLSNGGPIIVPNTKTLCLTPVAPHSLNTRPIVIDDNSVVNLSVESRSHNFLVAIDGRSEKCDESVRLSIRKAPWPVKIIKRKNKRYFNTLRDKMLWGLDARG